MPVPASLNVSGTVAPSAGSAISRRVCTAASMVTRCWSSVRWVALAASTKRPVMRASVTLSPTWTLYEPDQTDDWAPPWRSIGMLWERPAMSNEALFPPGWPLSVTVRMSPLPSTAPGGTWVTELMTACGPSAATLKRHVSSNSLPARSAPVTWTSCCGRTFRACVWSVRPCSSMIARLVAFMLFRRSLTEFTSIPVPSLSS